MHDVQSTELICPIKLSRRWPNFAKLFTKCVEIGFSEVRI
jgi:hypothetical protein